MSSIKHPSEAAKGFSACVRAAEHDCSIDRPTDCFRAVELSRLTYAILAPELKIRRKEMVPGCCAEPRNSKRQACPRGARRRRRQGWSMSLNIQLLVLVYCWIDWRRLCLPIQDTAISLPVTNVQVPLLWRVLLASAPYLGLASHINRWLYIERKRRIH
jgi:hypothetical protein